MSLREILRLVLIVGCLPFSTHVAAQEAPYALVKRISLEVIDSAKADKEIQAGNQKRVQDLVEAKILPHVDFQRMTALAAGRNWRKANAEQQKQLVSEFRALLVHIYSGAISQIKDQRISFKPMRGAQSDSEVTVRSVVVRTRGEPIQLEYRLEKHADGWKIFDFNILGAWLVQTYRSSFAVEIRKGGIDGLIKVLADKNKKLNATSARN